MSDDLERRLDDLYRQAREGAGPVRARWASAPRRARPLVWAAVAAAAALAILLPLLLRKSAPPVPAPSPVVHKDAPLPPPPPPSPPIPVAPEKTPLPAPKPAPKPAPAPAPAPAPPTPEPEPEPAPPADPPKPEPKPAPLPPKPPTVVERAVATLREVDGAADLAGRPLKGAQKDVVVADGERLTAQAVVRLTLAPDRSILLAPRAQVVFRPSKERLTLALEQGELIAELNAPGPELLVVTRTCEIRHLGTIFAAKVEEKRTIVLVEEGRVDVRSPGGQVVARAGQAVIAPETAAPTAGTPPELRLPAWARTHRPAERVLYLEDFTEKGGWQGQVENGVGRTVKNERLSGSTMMVGDSVRHLFEVPARGQMSIVYQADRAGRLKVQMFSNELKSNYRYEASLLKTQGWKTLTFDFDDMMSNLPNVPPKPTPGAGFANLMLQFDEDGDRGSLWVDSIRVVSIR